MLFPDFRDPIPQRFSGEHAPRIPLGARDFAVRKIVPHNKFPLAVRACIASNQRYRINHADATLSEVYRYIS